MWNLFSLTADDEWSMYLSDPIYNNMDILNEEDEGNLFLDSDRNVLRKIPAKNKEFSTNTEPSVQENYQRALYYHTSWIYTSAFGICEDRDECYYDFLDRNDITACISIVKRWTNPWLNSDWNIDWEKYNNIRSIAKNKLTDYLVSSIQKIQQEYGLNNVQLIFMPCSKKIIREIWEDIKLRFEKCIIDMNFLSLPWYINVSQIEAGEDWWKSAYINAIEKYNTIEDLGVISRGVPIIIIDDILGTGAGMKRIYTLLEPINIPEIHFLFMAQDRASKNSYLLNSATKANECTIGSWYKFISYNL